jgi:small GTP-binding protein
MTKYKVFLFGLDYAGKTSIVNSIKDLPDPGNTTPTMKFDISDMILENTEFVIWDAPGQLSYRKKWDVGALESEILCFVLEITAPERFDEAKKVLIEILDESETKNFPLIICFNKIDIIEAKKNLPKVKELFKPDQFFGRQVYQLETSIMNPDSILKLKKLFVDIIAQTRW